jgi:glutamine cyclotransferase
MTGMFHSRLAAFAVPVLVALGCASSDESTPEVLLVPIGAEVTTDGTPVLAVGIDAEVPHDRNAFTQGFLIHEGRVFESTGLRGQSTLREVDLESGEVLRSVALGEEFFAEGLTLVDDRLIQITWQEETAFVYDLETFEVIDEFSYDGEGWGICYDGHQLVMSNGSDELTFRDPETFEETGQVTVLLDGDPVPELNELECVDGMVYANVWQTDHIVVIDPATGEVTAVIDAAGLLEGPELTGADVLNGIAYDADTDSFWITGKQWPTLFEVTFVNR